MKVRDLIEQTGECRELYGDDVLDWNVYVQQLEKGVIVDSQGWRYSRCEGLTTHMPGKKVFTINVRL